MNIKKGHKSRVSEVEDTDGHLEILEIFIKGFSLTLFTGKALLCSLILLLFFCSILVSFS